MAKNDFTTVLKGELFDDRTELSLAELCHACQLPAESILELVAEGVIEPVVEHSERWLFHAIAIKRVRCVQRLRVDLGVNTAGAALAIELLEELERLRVRLNRLE